MLFLYTIIDNNIIYYKAKNCNHFFVLRQKKDIFLHFVLGKFTNLIILLEKSEKKLLTNPPFCGYNSNCRKMGADGKRAV